MIILGEVSVHSTEGNAGNALGLGLGRRVALDPRDKQHALPRSIAVPPKTRNKYYVTGPVLDQGDTPHCVAYSWEQFLVSAPVKNKQWGTPADLYHQAQLVDEWEGEDYEGTSVRAGAKVLQSLGYLSEYQWAFDANTAAAHVLTVGPVVFGTTWYWDMFEPDKNGFVHATGEVAGGHAYMIKGVNLDKKCPDGTKGAFRIINSWGKAWGQNGLAWLSFTDANKLIADNGEVCTAKELKFQVEKA